MEQVDCIDWDENGYLYEVDAGYNWSEKHDPASFQNLILMQFTGLPDKNGKEIYEGDIMDVKFNGIFVERIGWSGEPDARAEVFWDFSGFRLKCKGPDDQRYADWFDTDGYFDPILDMSRSHSEVIGNIYENPELLKWKLSSTKK